MNSSTSSSDLTGFDGRFLLRIALAAGLVAFLFLLWSEVFLRTRVAAVSPYYLQQRLFQHLANVPAVLIGDSHTSQDVLASATAPNFGLAGENIPQMQQKLVFVLEKHPEIKTVILQASPHMFADYRYSNRGRRDYGALLGGAPRSYMWSDSYLRDRLGWYIRQYFTKGTLALGVEFSDFGSLLSDHEMSEPKTARAKETVRKRVQEHRVTRPLTESPHFQIYRDMLTMLNQRNIAVCMVEYPVAPIHRRFTAEMAPEFAAIRETFHGLAREFGATYKSYWGAFDDYAYFRNADHLNRRGAAVLTPLMMRDCGLEPTRQARAKTG